MRSRKFTNWVGWHFITVDSGPEKKLTKLISEVLKRAPVLHLFGNIHLLPVDFLGTQLPSSALASTFIKEAQKEASTVKTAYLASLDEDLTRSAPILQNGLVNWLVSFDSTVSPMVQQLAIHAMLGLRLKQLAQVVASQLVLSYLTVHLSISICQGCWVMLVHAYSVMKMLNCTAWCVKRVCS
jgi:hypothetical protein